MKFSLVALLALAGAASAAPLVGSQPAGNGGSGVQGGGLLGLGGGAGLGGCLFGQCLGGGGAAAGPGGNAAAGGGATAPFTPV
ncbi:unnamed protein product [Sympodiomycopsis kandeliae]